MRSCWRDSWACSRHGCPWISGSGMYRGHRWLPPGRFCFCVAVQTSMSGWIPSPLRAFGQPLCGVQGGFLCKPTDQPPDEELRRDAEILLLRTGNFMQIRTWWFHGGCRGISAGRRGRRFLTDPLISRFRSPACTSLRSSPAGTGLCTVIAGKSRLLKRRIWGRTEDAWSQGIKRDYRL